jgi:hypothetical protein
LAVLVWEGCRTLCRKEAVLLEQDERASKRTREGVDGRQPLNSSGVRKARVGQAKVRTGLGKTDRPGS